MKMLKWFDRKFDFCLAPDSFPNLAERLVGTPARLEEKCRSLSPGLLTLSMEGAWTVKQHIGHLSDLEPLWQKRIEDILAGKPEMLAADLENRKTHEANHNEASLDDLQSEFRKLRFQTLAMADKLGDDDLTRSSFHPRLKTPMRIIDLFLFVAEHDDHHLAKISEIIAWAPSSQDQ
jgi:uncharacterized damage-inducible protein DinB